MLEDIIAFANIPPRAYLLSLESWLTENGFVFEKIGDNKGEKERKKDRTTVAVGTAVGAIAANALAMSTPIGIGLASLGAAAAMKRKNYHNHYIRLIANSEENNKDADVYTKGSKESYQQAIVDHQKASKILLEENRDFLENECGEQSNQTQTIDLLPNVLDEIKRAKHLLDIGVLTQEEFSNIKARLIAKL